MKQTVSLKTKEALAILRDLNFVVVSLDRILSRGPDYSDDDFKAELTDMIVEGRVFRRMAKVRKVVSVAVDAALSSAEINALEERADRWKAWSVKRETSDRGKKRRAHK